MNSVALLTPTYGRDHDLCALLCESVDRHVQSFAKHFLLVPDSDLALFAHFESERRSVIPASVYLPKWLRPLPRIIQRKRRQFWWSLRHKPVSGWHVQQILKVAAAITLPYERFCILDSDIVFFRDFDLSQFEYPKTIPFLDRPNMVTSDKFLHERWVETSHQLLGLPTPPLPASDFIGHIIFWDQRATRAMTEQIESTTGTGWIDALCLTREFSEYMLYGYFVQNDPEFAAQHVTTAKTRCVSYWDQPKLSRSKLDALLLNAEEADVAVSVASFSGTPVETIRAVVKDNERARTPLAIDAALPSLSALC